MASRNDISYVSSFYLTCSLAMENSASLVDEVPMHSSCARKNGGWITFPFIIGTFLFRVEFKI